MTTGASAGWFHDTHYQMDGIGKSSKDLVEARGISGVGSHGQAPGTRLPQEVWSIARGGLPNHDLLRVATIHGATALGLERDVGSIEVGKMADLVILNAIPLQNIRNTNTIHQIMKNGRLYGGNTLGEVYPRQVKAGPFPWLADERPVARKR